MRHPLKRNILAFWLENGVFLYFFSLRLACFLVYMRKKMYLCSVKIKPRNRGGG